TRFSLWSDAVSAVCAAAAPFFAVRLLQRGDVVRLFGRFVSPAVVRTIVNRPALARAGGRKRKITLLFSDIRDFTALSETMPPDRLVSFINEYLDPMSEIVLNAGGTLDKFIGDAVMAFWGAPLEQPDTAARAVDAALRMKKKLNELNARWEKEGGAPIAVGIGIHTGEAVVGNVGSRRRLDYTAMGDAVNLASRVEGLTRLYGVTILVTEATKAELGDRFATRFIDRVRVKGRTKPVEVHEVIG
ncbi:MAG: adenylate/guanylate cyclase domain-containing protein, partial [bacterium]